MAKSNVWMSVSDLMTGLMIIFLFIAIAYISRVQQNQTVLTDYIETKNKLYDKLVSEFMKFNNPTVLFAQGSAYLTPQFKSILDEFLPRYFDILLNDNLRSKIQEIRIEGHTDNVPYPKKHADPYIANVILSQERALNVLIYLRQMPIFQQYTKEQKELLEFWFTANGLSYGKSLDSNGKYTYKTKNEIDPTASRRVEFRIVTSGEEVLENFVNKNAEYDGQ